MLKNTTTIILAAGSGSRMLSSLPKVLHKVAQQPLLEYVIKLAKNCSEEVITVINKELASHKSFNKLINNYKTATALQLKPLGTADAVKSAIEYVKSEYTLILYADVPFVEESTIKKMWEKKSDLVVLGFEHFKDKQYGRIVVDERNRPIKIIEKKDAKEEELKITLCHSGILLIKTALLKEFLDKVSNNNNSKEYYLTDLIEFVYKHKNLYKSSLIKTPDYNEIIGINNKSQLAYVEGILQEKLRTSLLNKGVIMIAPNTVFLTPTTRIEKDAIIHPFVFFGPNVWIGSDVTVLPFSHLEGVKVEKGAIIGPFARIRPKTEIKENSKIGNFVEVKNTVLDKDTKVSHLSYIGDATIGKNVNIGAGTIFCNYDGRKKYHSTVGNNSFIGSNSCIISPIQIDENVLVGAGSVVTQDIPANHLAIARVKQKNIKKRI
ncbi:MAG: bifunctional UDP-N-acetylglucosamine diphosphorylase/glucosamine-1-phosphate N-acetyltransferase GlmU [Candidatus Midichloria sp.]|nr:MAG: bifunctional UDP-N-acetylglucosamine diphosphorylase/glucosamine-1-phosphate N-acetyltransferase GlmU [Candidatus Midichloria sp.]